MLDIAGRDNHFCSFGAWERDSERAVIGECDSLTLEHLAVWQVCSHLGAQC